MFDYDTWSLLVFMEMFLGDEVPINQKCGAWFLSEWEVVATHLIQTSKTDILLQLW